MILHAIPTYYRWKRFESHCIGDKLGTITGSRLSLRVAIYSGICLHQISGKIVERKKVNKSSSAKSPISASVLPKIRCRVHRMKMQNINVNTIALAFSQRAKHCVAYFALPSEFFSFCTTPLCRLHFALRQRKPSSIVAFPANGRDKNRCDSPPVIISGLCATDNESVCGNLRWLLPSVSPGSLDFILRLFYFTTLPPRELFAVTTLLSQKTQSPVAYIYILR